MIRYRYCPQCRRPMSKDAEEHPYCKHCDITIYRNVATCANILPVKSGRALLAIRAKDPYKGTIDTIGGFLQTNETAEAGGLREAKEETGLKMKIKQFLGDYPDQYGKDGDPLLTIAFVAEIIDNKQPKPADDVAALKWFPISKLPFKDVGFPSAKQVLKDLKNWYQDQP